MEIKTTNFSGKLYRLQDFKYFEDSPDRFYENYLETKRVFNKQDRFAGRNHNCGFYFGSHPETVISEMYFYLGLKHNEGETINDCLKRIKQKTGKNYMMLEVKVEITDTVSLLNSDNLAKLIEKYILRKTLRRNTMVLDLYSMLSSLEAGGTEYTDTLGYFVKSNGFNSLIFPSSRTIGNINLTSEYLFSEDLQNLIERTVRNDEGEIKFKYHAFNTFYHFNPNSMAPLGQEEFERFLRDYYNFVFLNGSLCCRSIKNYSINDGNKIRCHENPFFGITDIELERIRIDKRKKLNLNEERSIEFGYLAEEEINDIFDGHYLII